MDNMYNTVSERLWEKIEYHRDELDLDMVDLKDPFPVDQLSEVSPIVKTFIAEVEKEFDYEMSEFQCSWAVAQAIRDRIPEYNIRHTLSLMVRPRHYK